MIIKQTNGKVVTQKNLSGRGDALVVKMSQWKLNEGGESIWSLLWTTKCASSLLNMRRCSSCAKMLPFQKPVVMSFLLRSLFLHGRCYWGGEVCVARGLFWLVALPLSLSLLSLALRSRVVLEERVVDLHLAGLRGEKGRFIPIGWCHQIPRGTLDNWNIIA